MFTWFYHRGFGNKATRFAIIVSVVAVIVVLLMVFVFPELTDIFFPPSANTV